MNDCEENVPVSLRLTQPIENSSSLTASGHLEGAARLEDRRQIRVDSAETLAPLQSPAASKAKQEPAS
jgi:hypothetical protein